MPSLANLSHPAMAQQSAQLHPQQSHIYFIALPCPEAHVIADGLQPASDCHIVNIPDPEMAGWQLTITPVFGMRTRTLPLLNTAQHQSVAAYLTDRASIRIPHPHHPAPLASSDAGHTPFWLVFEPTPRALTRWQAPLLTPDLAEQLRKAKLAERMADRAFYFGYDTNDDALK